MVNRVVPGEEEYSGPASTPGRDLFPVSLPRLPSRDLYSPKSPLVSLPSPSVNPPDSPGRVKNNTSDPELISGNQYVENHYQSQGLLTPTSSDNFQICVISNTNQRCTISFVLPYPVFYLCFFQLFYIGCYQYDYRKTFIT